MSLLGRKPVRIGRAQREARDDRVFLVATEDTHAPAQYFNELAFRRVKVFILPTENPDSPRGYWPEKAGTRAYLLLESILGKQPAV